MHDDEVTALGLAVSYPPPPIPPSEKALEAFRNASLVRPLYGMAGGDTERWIHASPRMG